MKNNKGFTLVELIIVASLLTMVTFFFWNILNSSSEDSYTLTEKVEVQNSVTTLMNTIQKDVQEAKIVQKNSEDDKRILISRENGDEKCYIFNTYLDDTEGSAYYNQDTVEYTFNPKSMTVIRKKGTDDTTDIAEYNNIIEFSLESIPDDNNKYGVKVNIRGGKKPISYEGLDKSRYSLNSTFYTRNTR